MKSRTAAGTFSLVGIVLGLTGCAAEPPADADVTVVTAHQVQGLTAGERLKLRVNTPYRFESSGIPFDFSRIDVVDGSDTLMVDALVDEPLRASPKLELTFGSFEGPPPASATGAGVQPQATMISSRCLPMVECAFYSDGAFASCGVRHRCAVTVLY